MNFEWGVGGPGKKEASTEQYKGKQCKYSITY